MNYPLYWHCYIFLFVTNKCLLVARHRRRRDWQQKGQLERRHGISEWGNWNGIRKRYTTQLSWGKKKTHISTRQEVVLINHKCFQNIPSIVWNIEGVPVFPHFFFIKSRHGDWLVHLFQNCVSTPTSFSFYCSLPPCRALYLVATAMTAYFWFIKRIYSTSPVILQLPSRLV